MYRCSISLYTDGACDNTGRGDVGYSTGGGVVLQVGSEYRLLESTYGTEGTSNVAEWLAMYRGLIHLKNLLDSDEFRQPGVTVVVRTDSMLVIKQLTREWITSNRDLYTYLQACCRIEADIIKRGHHIHFRWVPREQNDIADILSKIGRRTKYARRPSFKRFKSLDELLTYGKETDYGRKA